MKVAIIAANNTRYSPYIFFYTRILDHGGIDYEIIVPDRNKGIEQEHDKIYVLPWKANINVALCYIGYAKNVKKLVKEKKYDALIVLTGNNAAFLSLWLKKHYAGRYIIDIRDYTHENIKPYYWLEQQAVKHSLLNVVSSAKFRSFLPKAEYAVCHNVTVTEKIDTHFEKVVGRKINIGYVGALSYFEQCRRMMELVRADDRFRLSFYGTSNQEIKMREFAKSLNCDRIHFFGAYDNKDKPQIIQKVDILFNAYGNGIPLLDFALSNKMYDAMAFKKPILTSPTTYMDELAGIMSFPIDLNTADSLNALYDWYVKLTSEDVNAYAEKMHENFLEENQVTCRLIEEKLKSL